MMPHEIKTQPCLDCGGTMRYGHGDDILGYGGHERVIKTLGWWCNGCGEAIFMGAPLVTHEKALQELKAEIDGAMAPNRSRVPGGAWDESMKSG
jgi:YgiT-type zinc finger domain-containing protein